MDTHLRLHKADEVAQGSLADDRDQAPVCDPPHEVNGRDPNPGGVVPDQVKVEREPVRVVPLETSLPMEMSHTSLPGGAHSPRQVGTRAHDTRRVTSPQFSPPTGFAKTTSPPMTVSSGSILQMSCAGTVM
jgi:hypothetical protein